MSFRFAITIVFLRLVWVISLPAQTPTATLVGTVYDSSGAVIPNAAVEVKNRDTNETRKTVSSERGEFTVPNLMPGTYEVTTMKEGFRSRRETDIELALDQAARLEIRLEVGANTQATPGCSSRP